MCTPMIYMYVPMDSSILMAAGRVDGSCIVSVGLIVPAVGLISAYHLLLQFYLGLTAT